jgi:hypothetical protein
MELMWKIGMDDDNDWGNDDSYWDPDNNDQPEDE